MSHPPATPVTNTLQRILRYTIEAGLRPHTLLHDGGPNRPTYRGQMRIILNGAGPSSPFGAIIVGANSGRVLRATIKFGNDGRVSHFTGAREVSGALRSLAQHHQAQH